MRDLLVCQVTAPPGAILKSIKCLPHPTDTNQVDVSCDLDEKLSSGSACVRTKWVDNNRKLAKQIAGGLSSTCKSEIVPGGNHEHETGTFAWDDGLQSTINPVDPCTIGLRRTPSGDRPLVEIKCLALNAADGRVMPCHILT